MNILDLIHPLSKVTGYETDSLTHFFQSSNEKSIYLNNLRQIEEKLRMEFNEIRDIEVEIQDIIKDYFQLQFDEIIVKSKLIFSKAEDQDILLFIMILELLITGKEKKFRNIEKLENIINHFG